MSSDRAEHRFDALICAAVDAILIIDGRGLIKTFNPAAEKMFGYRPNEVIGRNVSYLMPEPYQSEHDSYLHNYLSTHQAKIIGTGREVKARRKNGQVFPMELSVGEIKGSDSVEFVGIIRDLSHRKLQEAQLLEQRVQLEQVSRAGMLGEVAAGLAHELNQPLAAISTYAVACRNMIEQHKAVAEELDEPLHAIEASAKRAGAIIHRLRALLAKDSAECEYHALNALIRVAADLAKPIVDACDVQLNLTPAIPDVDVLIDEIHLQQVMLNVIKNAAEALAECSQPRTIDVTVEVEAELVKVIVSDNGPGVSEAELENIFLPFHSSKEEGLGVGLSLCRSLLRANDGDIFAQENAVHGLDIVLEMKR